LESPKTGSQIRLYRDLSRWRRPATRHLNSRKCPRSAGYLSETGKRRFVSECVVGPGEVALLKENISLALPTYTFATPVESGQAILKRRAAWRANVVNDPARDQRRAGSLVPCSAAPLLLHDDRRADLDPVIEIDHVLIGKANAAR
jgi:hypothetical protein